MAMTAAKYEAIFAWFRARPAAQKALRIISKGAVAVVYAAYALAVLVAAWQGLNPDGAGGWRPLATLVAVPGAVFVLGTALRAGINRPRPYEALGFTPLYPKSTKGQSLPSRHCFAAAAIAVTIGSYNPVAGVVLGVLALLLAACRVLMGHHYPSDVAAGLAFGAALAALGLWAMSNLPF